jgi:hypothetical protein
MCGGNLLTKAQVFLPSVQGRREGLQFIFKTIQFSPPFQSNDPKIIPLPIG